MIHHKTYRFKLNPTKEQQAIFRQWLGTCRYLYNTALELKIWAWGQHGKNVSKYDLQNELPNIRKDIDWIRAVNAQTLQDALIRLDLAYQNFFDGGGFPRFANRDSYRSLGFPQNVKVCGNTKKVYLPKIGEVRYRKSQEVQGKIKTATVVREYDGWYICIVCEVDIVPYAPVDKSVGLDMGVKSVLVTSDGLIVDNPRTLRKYEHKLKQAQRSVSRKKKGSNNRKKAVAKVAKIHKKIRETRKDSQHKLTTQLVRENQTIAVEELKTANLSRRCKPKEVDGVFVPNGQAAKSGLNKVILDVGFATIVGMLEHKCKWYGRELIKVPAAYTSQDCHACGWRNSDLKLSDRGWKCSGCGMEHDRDINAARNILNKAVGQTVSACGDMRPQ